MGFLAPWFLASAAAVGLPIYLHLLRRHRTTPLPFSSLMFFERRTQSSIKHRRLRYLLLLAFRLTVILLLALAFANPFIERSAASMSGEKLDLLVIDYLREENRVLRLRPINMLMPGPIGNREAIMLGPLQRLVADDTRPFAADDEICGT